MNKALEAFKNWLARNAEEGEELVAYFTEDVFLVKKKDYKVPYIELKDK